VSLRDPGAHTKCQVLAESQDVLMNLILGAYQKRASTAVEPEERQKQTNSAMYKQMQITPQLSFLSAT